jgi:hypothetical protein
MSIDEVRREIERARLALSGGVACELHKSADRIKYADEHLRRALAVLDPPTPAASATGEVGVEPQSERGEPLLVDAARFSDARCRHEPGVDCGECYARSLILRLADALRAALRAGKPAPAASATGEEWAWRSDCPGCREEHDAPTHADTCGCDHCRLWRAGDSAANALAAAVGGILLSAYTLAGPEVPRSGAPDA